ncbi:trans-sulfuration enzyme family protein [Arundinibacter roseus]|uniref:Aminotransferase class V-fold PLP-dependent enzyme n=1 Tax=Arundinibacter roseus TaxID=2070510 RepID=A0A4V2XAI7_9BACT|nr:aminotransferase class I/II-fold pyridoxal phosphate-dependent enzyme [Arundinibacter roseus]TDB67845.1 aminotransferase class V-fold PLP-dependent enzyme [Arundinibacter roseus]
MKPETLALRSTHPTDNNASAVVAPIYLSTTFERNQNYELPHGFLYSRAGNPNRQQLEHALATLEGGTEAMAFASGQAATMSFFQALNPGDHVLVPDDAYYGTPALLQEVFTRWGLTFSKIDSTDPGKIEAAIRPETKVLWLETPSNPLVKVADLTVTAALAKTYGLLTVCDNTWATPLIQRPLDLGCDVVMHSTTKYLSGHSDVLGGALIFKESNELSGRIRQIQTLGGAVASPFDCWLTSRGIKTLAVRIKQQSANAAQLATFLETHAAVERVHYPGLPSHAGYEIAQKQMKLPGAMLSVQVKGGAAEAIQCMQKLQLFTRATSLGGVESLIEHRASVEGPDSLTPANLLRISVGLEHIDDLLNDLTQALG